MQVFMPSSDLRTSACCLDPKRLGNQVYREAKTLISGGWPNHPAAKIWADYKPALALYAVFGLLELSKRGRHYDKWLSYYSHWLESNQLPSWRYIGLYGISGWKPPELPPIIGYAPFHSGHRAALLAKDPDWYSQFGWAETPKPDTKRAYIWTLP